MQKVKVTTFRQLKSDRNVVNIDRWRQIDELFDAALDLPEIAREDLLAEKCDGDEALKEEVLSLLKARTDSNKFLEDPAIEIAAQNLADEQTIAIEAHLFGKNIGTYKIESLLGSGGMGEVYLAIDEKLNRKVALKILPAGYITNDERVKRFQLEARAISALNHPNIFTIHDIGNFEGINYIATEYVEGKTLRELIGNGLKLKEILSIIIQCCEALSAAHSAGIIHRDIKPENIMFRPDGYIKILDFGLAKLTENSSQNFRDMAKTAKGIMIGTPSYMSPEQIAGDKLDHRTDLWSIGVVLYELVTGTNPFKKSSRQMTFQAILSEIPPLASSLNEEVSEALDSILIKALEKEAELSYQTASDLQADLKRFKREIDSSSSLRGSSRSIRTESDAWLKKRHLALIFGSGLLAVLGFGIWFYLFKSNETEPPDWTRATNMQLSDQAGTEYYPSLSPDGKTFVFAMKNQNGDYDIFSQRIGGKNVVNLTGDSPAQEIQPAFSFDGEYIAFRSEREPAGIYVMGASGENPRRVSDFGYHPAWSPDGKQIAISTNVQDSPSVRNRSSIWTINLETGEKSSLIDNFALQPNWSPDGKFIAYWFSDAGGKRNVATIPAGGGEPSLVTDTGNTNWNPVWSPDGKFLYFASDRGGSMAFWLVKIDDATGKPIGNAEVVPTPSKFNRHLSFSRDGKRMIYVQTQNQSNLQNVAFDLRSEKVTEAICILTEGNREITHPEISPDGLMYVARQASTTQEDIILLNNDGTLKRNLTDDMFFDRYPRWSPDGKKIAFVSDRTGKYEIWMINADGTNLKQITFSNSAELTYSMPAWSPDGGRLSFDNSNETFILDLSKQWNVDELQKIPKPAGSSYFRIWDWSPDGKKLVGLSSEGEMYGMVVYDFEKNNFEKLDDYAGFIFWLPDNRRVIHAVNGKAVITDTETKNNLEIKIPTNEQIRHPRVNKAGNLLYFLVTGTESDIWLLDLTQN